MLKNLIGAFWVLLELLFLFLCYRLFGLVISVSKTPLEGITEKIKAYRRCGNRTGLSETGIRIMIAGVLLLSSIIVFLISGTSLSEIKESLFPYLMEDKSRLEAWKASPFLSSVVLCVPGLLIETLYKIICWIVCMIKGVKDEHISRANVLLCSIVVFLGITIMESVIGEKTLYFFKDLLDAANKNLIIVGLLLIPVLYMMLDALFSNGFLLTQCVFTICAISHPPASGILCFLLIVVIGLIANIVLTNVRSKEDDFLEKTNVTYKFSVGIIIVEWILFTIIFKIL